MIRPTILPIRMLSLVRAFRRIGMNNTNRHVARVDVRLGNVSERI